MPTRRPITLAIVSFTVSLACCAQDHGVLETTSLLGRKLYAQTDDSATSAAEAKLAGGSATPADYLALSKAEAGRRQYQEAVKTDTEALAKFPDNPGLLLERGHRELGLREFAQAQQDLERAVQLDPSSLDNHYHLGLALYFQGRFAEAAMHFRHARDLATSDDSLIDCSNWLYVSLRRAGDKEAAAAVLTRITPAVHNTEPHLAFYLRLLRFYEGQMTEVQILPSKPPTGDSEAELSYDTISYGLGNWHLYNSDRPAALPYFQRVTTGEAWNAWGFLGSEVELAHPQPRP